MIKKIKYFSRHALNYLKRSQKKNEYLKFCQELPINNKLFFIESFQGRNLSDNPKALYLEMLNNPHYQDFEFVISLKELPLSKHEYYHNERTTIVISKSSEYYCLLAQAKYIIANSVFDLSFKKRAEQIYLQTWHGTPLKKLGFDLDTKGSNDVNKPWQIREMYKQDAKRYDLICSPSTFFTKHITSAFALAKWYDKSIVVETGYPRTDFIINHTDKDIAAIKEKYNLPKNKKIILYAPTWREDNHSIKDGYQFDLKLDLEALRQELADDYIIILRIHYLISKYLKIENDDFVYDLSNVDDIAKLYVISDLLITDYSSALFDYALLKRPMIYFMYDYEKYKNETRGFYFDVKTLPGPIVETNEQLLAQLTNIDDVKKSYANEIIEFNKTYNYLEDGNSSQRVIEKLIEKGIA